MTVAELGSIGEFLGSIAILVTLVYLAIQTRLTRKEMSSTALNNIFASFKSVNQAVIASEEVAVLYEKGLRDPSSLTRGERLRFFMLVREATNAYVALYRQLYAAVEQELEAVGIHHAYSMRNNQAEIEKILREISEGDLQEG